ncbi:unnamed protein product [Penicillium salamii]|uniref:Centrosomin N-terminal motif 1 domain-containing protein n=1 Tax=Penicillium salamii TaxID=1612424 RepID=A0A9W4IRU2_9EURO|nr:unnamed protein product [Penicillium salamii]CAG8334628.1 unnamed protein product [Penicillium salamii]CAG8358772.1 unnamed protein product [Penicillium salamii]CAG8369382.1 unnamed protein product [Penicillium salamii]
MMPAATMHEKIQRSSAAGQPAPSHSQPPVYHSNTAPKRTLSSKPHLARNSKLTLYSFPDSSDRPQHPSLSRVKGRNNMFTPPPMSAEGSWLRDQSPAHPGTRTPNRSQDTPEPDTPSLVNPSSALLQDLLKEQRAHRGSRGNISEDLEHSAPRTPETVRLHDDTASEKARKINDALSAGQRKPKEMGMREMDTYVSKMNKLNFDLKLEVFHRTQQMKILEQKLERMAEMEEQLTHMDQLEAEVQELRTVAQENQMLREKNKQLSEDFKNRDQAVVEAVDLICQLETKIDVLENGGRTSKMSMSRPRTADGSDVLTPKARTMVEIPERTSSRRSSRSSSVMNVARRQTSSELRKLSKAPSFLRLDDKSTATLRGLYEPHKESRTETTGLAKSESFHTMTETMEPESPRLSVLSECSELNTFDTPTRWDELDHIDIPVRKASSTTGSIDSYVRPFQREESKEDQIDRWMQSREDMNDTIITRRRNRAYSDASKAGIPSLVADLYSQKPRGRGRLDGSLFEGIALPPTPDTMSTACVMGTNRSNGSNGSNGSIAGRKSFRNDHDPFFTAQPINRPHSAEEMANRCSFNSEVTDSMQANFGDTTGSGGAVESHTILPSYTNVSSKASELLGPGSPNNPAIATFGDIHHVTANHVSTPTIHRVRNVPKAMTPEPQCNESDGSPPLTPQDWIAAANQGPRSRKEKARVTSPELQQSDMSPRKAFRPVVFDDDGSVASDPIEADSPRIPTLDMTTLDILEQPLEVPQGSPQPEADPERRRRLSFRPPFFSRSTNHPRPLQASPILNDFEDDEDGAPSPIIPKTRTMGGSGRRPASQIYSNPNELYSSLQIFSEEPTSFPRCLPQSSTEPRMADLGTPAADSGRPSTSHGPEHKRRSSLGIIGWMKGKISDSADKPESAKEPRTPSRLASEASNGVGIIHPETSESFEVPAARPRSEVITHDDLARRPRYMGRRARRG